jgi:hypothetical protein
MKKSIGLLSALVVTSTFIVNCQKAPDKRRVRPNAKGVIDAAGTLDAKAVPTTVCEKALLDIWRSVYASRDLINKKVVTMHSSESEIETRKKLGVETLAKCDDVIEKLETLENEGCLYDSNVKSRENAMTTTSANSVCESLGKKLKLEVDLDSKYAIAAAANDKIKADNAEVEKLKKVTLNLSKEGKVLLTKDGVNGLAYIVNGELKKTGEVELAAAIADKNKTVCTFTGMGVEIKDEESISFKLLATSAGSKNDFKDISSEFTGKSTVLSFEMAAKIVEDEATTTAKDGKTLLCLNLDAEKLSIKAIESALGKVIASGTATVTASTEEKKEDNKEENKDDKKEDTAKPSQADTAAAQPAGSPQAALVQAGVDSGAIKTQQEFDPASDHRSHVDAKMAHDEQMAAQAAAKKEDAQTTLNDAKQTAAAREASVQAAKIKADRLEAEAVAADEEAKAVLADANAGKAELEEITSAAAMAAADLQTAQEALEALN